MVNSFLGLWHYTIIGRYYQYNDIRCFRTACAHGRKGGMARGIQKGNNAALGLNVVCTDMLCNTTGFGICNFACLDIVKQ